MNLDKETQISADDDVSYIEETYHCKIDDLQEDMESEDNPLLKFASYDEIPDDYVIFDTEDNISTTYANFLLGFFKKHPEVLPDQLHYDNVEYVSGWVGDTWDNPGYDVTDSIDWDYDIDTDEALEMIDDKLENFQYDYIGDEKPFTMGDLRKITKEDLTKWLTKQEEEYIREKLYGELDELLDNIIDDWSER